jgi:hypothetical protein
MNKENPSFNRPEENSPDLINTLVDNLNEKTEYMSVIGDMVELPEFQEMMKLGEDAFPYILSDKENFSHWHNVMAQYIARDIGETIEFPEEIKTEVTLIFNFVIAWLENRLQPETLPENG